MTCEPALKLRRASCGGKERLRCWSLPSSPSSLSSLFDIAYAHEGQVQAGRGNALPCSGAGQCIAVQRRECDGTADDDGGVRNRDDDGVYCRCMEVYCNCIEVYCINLEVYSCLHLLSLPSLGPPGACCRCSMPPQAATSAQLPLKKIIGCCAAFLGLPMNPTTAGSIAAVLLVVLLAAPSVAQMPCYSPPSTEPPCPDLSAANAARSAAENAVAAAAANRQAAHNAAKTAKENSNANLISILNAKVTENTKKLQEAKKKSDEIVRDVQKAADEAAESAKDAAKTKDEATNTVMLEIRPTWRPGCSDSLNKLHGAKSAGAQMEGALNSCAVGAGLLAFQMIAAGDACSGSVDACNDIKKKQDEAQSDLAKIKANNKAGDDADVDVFVNMVFANGLLGECATAAGDAALYAASAAGDLAAALQDQANGDRLYLQHTPRTQKRYRRLAPNVLHMSRSWWRHSIWSRLTEKWQMLGLQLPHATRRLQPLLNATK